MASGGELVKRQTFTPPKDAPAYLVDALGDIGLQEWVLNGRGRKVSNPTVERYIDKVEGHPLSAIDTPWCAYFIGAKLEYNGIACSKSGMARSYLKWGNQIDKHDDSKWKCGDIVIFWRGSPNGSAGHVAFLLHWDETNVYVLGGNQGDKVTIQRFPRTKVIGIARPASKWFTKINVAGGSTALAGAAKVAEEAAKAAPPVEAAESAKSLFEQVMSYFPTYGVALGILILGLGLYIIYRKNFEHKVTGK